MKLVSTVLFEFVVLLFRVHEVLHIYFHTK